MAVSKSKLLTQNKLWFLLRFNSLIISSLSWTGMPGMLNRWHFLKKRFGHQIWLEWSNLILGIRSEYYSLKRLSFMQRFMTINQKFKDVCDYAMILCRNNRNIKLIFSWLFGEYRVKNYFTRRVSNQNFSNVYFMHFFVKLFIDAYHRNSFWNE